MEGYLKYLKVHSAATEILPFKIVIVVTQVPSL